MHKRNSNRHDRTGSTLTVNGKLTAVELYTTPKKKTNQMVDLIIRNKVLDCCGCHYSTIT